MKLTLTICLALFASSFYQTIAQGQKVKQLEAETEFSSFLIKHIPDQYPNSTFAHHNNWYQIHIPSYELTVSWGLVPQKQLDLKEVEGLFENKSIFIAKEAKSNWTSNAKVDYTPNVGYFVSTYDSKTMGNFDVGQVTVIQFDGKPNKFVEEMVQAYGKNPNKSELEFVNWLKEYVKTTYPKHQVDFHGAWYQSVIPQLDLTVTWGTMDKHKMALKDLHGVREDKTFFIEKSKKVDWHILPDVKYLKETGYYLTRYSASSMSNFEVGDLCVIQFNGDAQKFVEQMAKEWRKVK